MKDRPNKIKYLGKGHKSVLLLQPIATIFPFHLSNPYEKKNLLGPQYFFLSLKFALKPFKNK